MYVTRAVKTEVLAHEGARNGVVGVLNEAHLGKSCAGSRVSERYRPQGRDCPRSVKGADVHLGSQPQSDGQYELLSLDGMSMDGVPAASRT